MDLLLFTRSLQDIEDTFALVERDGHRLEDPTVLRNQLPFFFFAQIHVIQNGGAGDGERTGVFRVADFHILRFDRNRFALWHGVGLILVLVCAGVDQHTVDFFVFTGRVCLNFLRGNVFWLLGISLRRFVRLRLVRRLWCAFCGCFCRFRLSIIRHICRRCGLFRRLHWSVSSWLLGGFCRGSDGCLLCWVFLLRHIPVAEDERCRQHQYDQNRRDDFPLILLPKCHIRSTPK